MTEASGVLTLFFDKLEADDEFFAYYGVDEDKAMELAKERAKSYLHDAVIFLRRRATGEVVFGLSGDSFTVEITEDEAELLSDIMMLKYYERGLAKLLPKLNVFSASELKMLHSPANERTSYNEMLKDFREHIREEISWYCSHDRLTGAALSVDYTGLTIDVEG